MKDKIFKLLKEKAGKTSVNDRTLEAYAKHIASKTTDESQIDAEIESYLELIKETDGNINSVAKKAAAEKEKEIQSKVNIPAEEKTPDEKKYLTAEDLAKILAEQKSSTEKAQSFEKMISDVKSTLSEKGLKPKLLSKLLANIKQSDELTLESLTTSIQKEYDEIYSDVVPESGKPSMAKLPNGDQVPSDIADFLKSKQDQINASGEKKELV